MDISATLCMLTVKLSPVVYWCIIGAAVLLHIQLQCVGCCINHTSKVMHLINCCRHVISNQCAYVLKGENEKFPTLPQHLGNMCYPTVRDFMGRCSKRLSQWTAVKSWLLWRPLNWFWEYLNFRMNTNRLTQDIVLFS